jgi:hypothetical protein
MLVAIPGVQDSTCQGSPGTASHMHPSKFVDSHFHKVVTRLQVHSLCHNEIFTRSQSHSTRQCPALTLVILGMAPVSRSGGLSEPAALPLKDPLVKLVVTLRPRGVPLLLPRPVARGVLLPAAPAELRLLRLLALLDLESPGDAGGGWNGGGGES